MVYGLSYWNGLLAAVFQASLTVLIGVSVYVLGQIISKIFIEPIHQLRLTIGEISDVLIFHANIYTNPGKCTSQEMRETQTILRQKAALLISRAHVITGYKIASFFRLVPRINNIRNAHRELIKLSNRVFKGDALENDETRRRIQEFLGLEIW